MQSKHLSLWSEDRVAKLKELWSDGLTTKRIAEELGHVTRNAVIGKATRIGLAGTRRSGPQKQGRPISVKPIGRVVGSQVQAINRRKKPAPVIVEEVFTPRTVDLPSHRKTILDLRAMECRWPDEDRDPETGWHTFCGCRTADASSYCPAHAELSKGQGTASERNALGLLRKAAA
jgi:GcrA cell cycle regulator